VSNVYIKSNSFKRTSNTNQQQESHLTKG